MFSPPPSLCIRQATVTWPSDDVQLHLPMNPPTPLDGDFGTGRWMKPIRPFKRPVRGIRMNEMKIDSGGFSQSIDDVSVNESLDCSASPSSGLRISGADAFGHRHCIAFFPLALSLFLFIYSFFIYMFYIYFFYFILFYLLASLFIDLRWWLLILLCLFPLLFYSFICCCCCSFFTSALSNYSSPSILLLFIYFFFWWLVPSFIQRNSFELPPIWTEFGISDGAVALLTRLNDGEIVYHLKVFHLIWIFNLIRLLSLNHCNFSSF